MRLLALALCLTAAACGNDPEMTTFPDGSGLYDTTGATVACPGAAESAHGTVATTCEWRCLVVDGYDVSSVVVEFGRPDATAPWDVTWTTWDLISAGCE